MAPASRTALLGTLLLLQGPVLLAQQPAVGSWNEVQTLPGHTQLALRTNAGKARCTLVRAAEDQIVCEDKTYARSEIRRVRLVRHGASTAHGLLVGLGIGVGGGAIVGAALGNSAFDTPGRGAAVGIAIFAPAGAIIGAAVGRTADHASRVLYER